jgi:alkyl sulfatase BDS1-like metallo-beta-lactamase superfamily hydrolase
MVTLLAFQLRSETMENSGPWDVGTYRGKSATAATAAANGEATQSLPLGDFLDGSTFNEYDEATRIAAMPTVVGTIDLSLFEYLGGDCPSSMHPSLFDASGNLWRDAGVYEITDDVFQIRGDIGGITLVRGATGWIVLDPGTSRDWTEQAWDFAMKHTPGGWDVPVSAVVYSHSHIDHFGGVKGLTSQADVDAGRTEIIAPHGFMDEAVSENILAGTAMGRRGQYHFGQSLDVEQDGTGFASVGAALQWSLGELTLIAPTFDLPEGPGRIHIRDVDGVEFHFKDISGAEAPAATLMYLPHKKMIFNSELIFRGMHNVYTLRGAKVRDALRWTQYVNEVIHEFGGDVELMTGPHGPTFDGNDRINEYMALQRDNIGFVHNQSLRLANKGVKIGDVGQAIEEMVPEVQRKVWHTQGYHGTYSHNARGVVNRYLGFYDGNPANLNPLQSEPEAAKFVEYMGGADAVIERATVDFEAGEYRFVATALNKVVTADPDNWPARHLLADALEQLGYEREGPQWRHAYLTAAKELRVGEVLSSQQIGSPDLLMASRVSDLLDLLGVLVISEKAEGLAFTINLVMTDTDEIHFIELANANLSHIQLDEETDADTTVRITKAGLLAAFSQATTVEELAAAGNATIEGDADNVSLLAGLLDTFDQGFAIVPMPTR